MIGKLTGEFCGVTVEGAALVMVGGVGYAVRVPLRLVESQKPGGKIALFIHTAVRDDAIDLYGFLDQEELAFFKLLMSVSGVGPKSALAILNVSDVPGLKRAIGAGDTSALHTVFGIGRKTAERVVVELRDKLGHDAGGAAPGTDAEVVEALTALGYRLEESRKALQHAPGETLNEKLSAALKFLGSRG